VQKIPEIRAADLLFYRSKYTTFIFVWGFAQTSLRAHSHLTDYEEREQKQQSIEREWRELKERKRKRIRKRRGERRRE